MNKLILAFPLVLIVSGCATPKIRVPVDAARITFYNAVVSATQDCISAGSIEIPRQHPNNYISYIKVEGFKLGATHYEEFPTEFGRGNRPIAGTADFYYCQKRPTAVMPTSQAIPQAVQQPTFIINNNNNNNNN